MIMSVFELPIIVILDFMMLQRIPSQVF